MQHRPDADNAKGSTVKPLKRIEPLPDSDRLLHQFLVSLEDVQMEAGPAVMFGLVTGLALSITDKRAAKQIFATITNSEAHPMTDSGYAEISENIATLLGVFELQNG